MTCAALSLIGVRKRYRAGVPGCSATVDALRAVDLRVGAGEILGLGGSVGAGKSTLLLCAAGVLRPDAGAVLWFGRRTKPDGPDDAVVFVPTDPAYYPRLTVRELLDARGAPCDSPGEDEPHPAARMARDVLDGSLHEHVMQLPRSRRRLVALALALAARPRLLLLDDTLSSADPAAMPALAAALRALAADGIATIIASRREAVLSAVATRRATLVDGVLRAPPVPAQSFRPRAAGPAPRTAGDREPARVAEGSGS